MQTAIDANKALIDLVTRFRGLIVSARFAYPEILHVEVRDDSGELWRFATQDADWCPREPAALTGRTIARSAVDMETGVLRCLLTDGSVFTVTPAEQLAPDDPSNWEVFAPDGLWLEYGPGRQWRLDRWSDGASPS